MHVVSSLLRLTLLQHIPVAIEGVGTLNLSLRSAQFISGQRLEPPRRMPELVATEVGDRPLAAIVAAELSLDPMSADQLCYTWQEEAAEQAACEGLPEGSLCIEGVGTIRNDPERGVAFYAEPELLEMLNPLPAEPLVVPSAARKHIPLPMTEQEVRRTRHRQAYHQRPKAKNPHNYTVSTLAILITLAAVGYLCYYLWRHTDWLSGILPR